MCGEPRISFRPPYDCFANTLSAVAGFDGLSRYRARVETSPALRGSSHPEAFGATRGDPFIKRNLSNLNLLYQF